jgi:hypothetical protein
MKWYYEIKGGHTHVRVFMNGGKCGDLCFRTEEFAIVQAQCLGVRFISETREPVIAEMEAVQKEGAA